MDVKCITTQQYSSGLWRLSLKAKRNCIVDKSLKIYIKLRDRSLFMEGGGGNFFFSKFLKLIAPPKRAEI